MSLQAFEQRIRKALAKASGLDEAELRVESPREASLGDLAFPCFPLAKVRKTSPASIAADLAQKLAGLEDVAVQASGPYLNFKISRPALAHDVLGEIRAQGERYGSSKEGTGCTVVIDLSSPNIAKPMSVGHLRSTVIGAAIQRLHDALGYTTVGINHIGDWGSQFGKLVAAIDRWGDGVDIEANPIRSLLALYVRYHDEEAADASLAKEASTAFQELESGREGRVRETWKRITALSLREFDKLYARLNVRFDLVRGESFYEPFLQETIERIEASGVAEKSKGALIVALDEKGEDIPPCLLRKSDGTTLYATRDLAAAFHRWELYHFTRCLYVVGGEQRLHFRQLKGVLRRMNLDWESRIEHIDFGMLRLPEGKMSTRRGRVVFLDEVLDRAVAEARSVIAAKNPDLARADEVAEQVGIGAVIFNDLKRERVKDVEFTWADVLSFEGETGPYVQYTHARFASILRKAQLEGPPPGTAPDYAALENAGTILVRLGRYPEVLRSAASRCEPSELSQYLLGLCRELNSFYVDNRVLGVEPAVSAARLGLIQASKLVLGNGLRILGLVALEEM